MPSASCIVGGETMMSLILVPVLENQGEKVGTSYAWQHEVRYEFFVPVACCDAIKR